MSMVFKRRSSEPEKGNKFYEGTAIGGYNTQSPCSGLTNQKYYGSVLYNCGGYAKSRWLECQCVNGKCADSASAYYNKTARELCALLPCATRVGNLKVDGTTVKLGSIIVWNVSSAFPYGHVGVIEKVYSNGNVDISMSNSWSKPLFQYRTNVNPASVYSGTTLKGYIYPKVTFTTDSSEVAKKDVTDTTYSSSDWIIKNSDSTTASRALTQSEMENNAVMFMKYVKNNYSGVTLNAIAGILGNIQNESTINSGRWEGDTVRSTSENKGYGFIQWTPWASKIGSSSWKTAFSASNMSDPEYQIKVIMAMLGEGTTAQVSLLNGNWIDRSGLSVYGPSGLSGDWYPYLSKANFLASTADAGYLAQVFHGCAEGSADGAKKINNRKENGRTWYEYLLPYWNGAEYSGNPSNNGEENNGKLTDNQNSLLSGLWSKRKTYKMR